MGLTLMGVAALACSTCCQLCACPQQMQNSCSNVAGSHVRVANMLLILDVARTYIHLGNILLKAKTSLRMYPNTLPNVAKIIS